MFKASRSSARHPRNTFKLQFQITKDGVLAISAGEYILNASGSIDRKSISGNTLTVAFVQRGVKAPRVLREQATKLLVSL